MRVDLPVRIRAVMGLIGVTLLLGMAVVVVNYGNGYYDSGYELVARFTSASQGLYEGSDVKVRGVNVGTVESIELDAEGRALVRMNIKDGFDVARTAEVSIEPLSIFGPKFLNLRLGDDELSGPFFAAGDVITNTVTAIEFTLVLGDASDLLEHIEPGDVSTVIHTVAEGIGGLGGEFGETLDHLTTLVDVAERNLPQGRQFLADLALVATTLGEHADEIATGVRRAHDVLPVINERPDEIGLLLDDVSRLSNTLGAILDINADVVDSTLIGLAEVADLLHRRQGDVVALVQTLDIFFGGLADILRVPNQPTTPLAGALVGGLPEDLCQLFPALPCLLGPVPTGTMSIVPGASS